MGFVPYVPIFDHAAVNTACLHTEHSQPQNRAVNHVNRARGTPPAENRVMLLFFVFGARCREKKLAAVAEVS